MNIIKIRDCVVNIEKPSESNAPLKTFTFDNAYDINASTENIYNDICYSIVENVLEGYNGTIFAYGQTGCGKSHTMQGPDVVHPPSHRGVIPRSFDHIFEAISVATDVQYLALVSYLEIYNENIRDLLNSSESSTANHPLKEIPGTGIVVQDLSTHAVHNAKECEELFQLGAKNRMVGATDMNAGSSRSHSIFSISIEQIETKLHDEATPSIRKGKLNLVDLAGSERQAKTGAVGMRLKEATKINLSLSALGNVISALVDGKTKHIPYRDSKLTRLLQDSLGGNTKTLMIACISPADYNYDETLSTLRYSSRAKNISNKPTINEDPKDTMLREYQEEIMKLKKMLQLNSNSGIPSDPQNFDQDAWLEEERTKLRAEYESETIKLREVHETQEKEKEELVKDMIQLKSHYENQMKNLIKVEGNNNTMERINLNTTSMDDDVVQQDALNRIEIIKHALIGGERANDVKLKEKRHNRKIAAQRRLSALAHALSRVEQGSDRDLLQEHYTDIQQELRMKTESLKSQRQKVRILEREVADLQSEFQLDRADYLESIRRLERNLKFYQQLLEKALPILRKDGKYWIPDDIQKASQWNDDLKVWKLPEDTINRFRLPPTASASAPSSQSNATDGEFRNNTNDDFTDLDNSNIAENYFRPKRNIEISYQRKGLNSWKDLALKLPKANNNVSSWPQSSADTQSDTEAVQNRVLHSWLPPHHIPISKTWSGLSTQNLRIPSLDNSFRSSQVDLNDVHFAENGNAYRRHLAGVAPSPREEQLARSQHLMTNINPTSARLLIIDQHQRRPRQLKALPRQVASEKAHESLPT